MGLLGQICKKTGAGRTIPCKSRTHQSKELRTRSTACELFRADLLALDESSGEPEAQPQVHVFDSAGLTTIQRADAQASGLSGHWVTEIHLSPDGYGELGVAFGPWMESHLANYP